MSVLQDFFIFQPVWNLSLPASAYRLIFTTNLACCTGVSTCSSTNEIRYDTEAEWFSRLTVVVKQKRKEKSRQGEGALFLISPVLENVLTFPCSIFILITSYLMWQFRWNLLLVKSPPQKFKILGGHLSLYTPHQCGCLCDLFWLVPLESIKHYGMFTLTDPESQSDVYRKMVCLVWRCSHWLVKLGWSWSWFSQCEWTCANRFLWTDQLIF